MNARFRNPHLAAESLTIDDDSMNDILKEDENIETILSWFSSTSLSDSAQLKNMKRVFNRAFRLSPDMV